MIRSFCCNLRAGIFPVVLGAALVGAVIPAFGQGYLFDPAGTDGIVLSNNLQLTGN